MTDWQIIDSSDFPDLPFTDEQESSGSLARRHWITLGGGILVFLVLVGFMTLHERQDERRTVIREDLAAVIFEEETHQFLGNEEYAVNLMMPNAPQSWQQAYRQTFENDEAPDPPGSIQIENIDFDGECAEITVTGLNDSEQVRHYCLDSQGWRRAPVPASVWGDEPIVVNVTDEVQLSFRPRDQAFGEVLANDLHHVFKELEQWSFHPGSIGSGQASTSAKLVAPRTLEIIIEPHDLRPPLVVGEEQRIVLNSPWLVPFEEYEGLTGESAVRLALANALLQRQGPFVSISETTLPGSANFLSTAQTVVAARIILTPEVHTILLDKWHSQLDGQWVSPFFTKLFYPDDPILLQQAQVSTHLMVDYIYETWGPATLGLILHQLPLIDSWDIMFQATLGRSTLELEQDVLTSLQAEPDKISTLGQLRDDALPLEATLLHVDAQNSGGSRVYVDLVNQGNRLLVELPPQVTFRTPDDVFLPSGCVPPGSELEIDGEWLERYQRLQATEITVQQVTPIVVEPAPADTMAYIIDGSSDTLTALRDDGSLHPLITLDSTLEVHPLPIVTGGTPHFMLIRSIPKCGRSWFAHYEPEQGIVGQWLGPLPPMQWVWRADHQDLMFFSRRGDVLGNDIYQTDNTLALRQVGNSNGSLRFRGWNTNSGQLISTDAWFGEIYLGLFDVESGTTTRTVQPPYLLLRSRRLSYDGNWLAHLVGDENLLGRADRLVVLDLNDGLHNTLIQVEPGEGLESPTWSLYLDHSTLTVLSGSVTETGELIPTRLLVASPDQPETFFIAAQATEGERLSTPVFCADGTLLYQAQQDGRYHLHQLASGLPTKTLLTLEFPFQLLACR